MKFAYHILIFRLLTYVKIANSIVTNVWIPLSLEGRVRPSTSVFLAEVQRSGAPSSAKAAGAACAPRQSKEQMARVSQGEVLWKEPLRCRRI